MNLSEKSRAELTNEIQFCRKKMLDEANPRMKLFYYSGIYSVLQRIFNSEYDPHLQLIHFVLNTTYTTINSRLEAVLSGSSTIPIEKDFFDNLAHLLGILENRIQENKETYDVLEKIVNLSYLTTGNGYYLSQKGVPVFQNL